MLRDSRINGRLIALAIGVIIVAAISYFVFTAISRTGKIAVSVSSLPNDATIMANGQKIHTGTVYLKPGTYEITANKKGFRDVKFSQYIGEGQTNISLALDPVSDEAIKWADKHQDEYLKAEGEAGKQASSRGEDFQTKNPIVSLLPYSNLLYTIGYKADPKDPSGNSIVIEIDASEGYRQSAVYQISQWGYNPADFTINFRDYQNPFAS